MNKILVPVAFVALLGIAACHDDQKKVPEASPAEAAAFAPRVRPILVLDRGGNLAGSSYKDAAAKAAAFGVKNGVSVPRPTQKEVDHYPNFLTGKLLDFVASRDPNLTSRSMPLDWVATVGVAYLTEDDSYHSATLQELYVCGSQSNCFNSQLDDIRIVALGTVIVKDGKSFVPALDTRSGGDPVSLIPLDGPDRTVTWTARDRFLILGEDWILPQS